MASAAQVPDIRLGRLMGAAEMLAGALRASAEAADVAPVALGLHAGSYGRLLCAARQMLPDDAGLLSLGLPEPGVTSLGDLAEESRRLAEVLRERMRDQYIAHAAGAPATP